LNVDTDVATQLSSVVASVNLLFSGFRHFVPWSRRGDDGGEAAACDRLLGGGYGTPTVTVCLCDVF